MAIDTKKILKGMKKRKKEWYDIVATKLFNEMKLGETTVADVSSIIGKPLKVNLMSLTNDIKKQNSTISFVITQIKGDKAVADPVSFEVMPAAIKRNIRRQRDRIDASFVCYTLLLQFH